MLNEDLVCGNFVITVLRLIISKFDLSNIQVKSSVYRVRVEFISPLKIEMLEGRKRAFFHDIFFV